MLKTHWQGAIALLGIIAVTVAVAVTAVLPDSKRASAAFVDAVSAGGFHSCALQSEGTLKCWGLNTRGQLGDGTSGNQRLTAVFTLESPGGQPLANVDAIALGGAHTCALTTGGGVKCWGRNEEGQLGDGNGGDFSVSPVNVSGLTSGVAAISSGVAHSCALTTGGGVKCWGDNASGQLGDGTTTEATTPVDVSGLSSGVTSISAGESHTCAVMSTGSVKCWGLNSFGQLGNGTNTPSNTPVDVCANGSGSGCSGGIAQTDIATVSAGGLHTCALTTTGGAKCWGFNASGQLGDNSSFDRANPVNVSGLASGTALIAAGREHSCARTAAGAAICWGRNDQGQLGDQSNENRDEPVTAFGLASGVASVTAGGFHTCALLSGAGVQCWGRNVDGQLGTGTTSSKQNQPQHVLDEKRPTDTPTSTLTHTPTETPTVTNTPTPTETPTPTDTSTETPTITPTVTLTPHATMKPTTTPLATATPNASSSGALRVDADCETPVSPLDTSVSTHRFVLVGSTFHVCVNTGFPASSASGYQAQLHWTEAFLNLNPRTSSVNDVWADQLPAVGGPVNGGVVSPQVTGPDDDTGDDAFIRLRADDQLNQNSAPPYHGPLAQFEFTCQAHGAALLEMRLPGGGGQSFLISNGAPMKSGLERSVVHCVDPSLDSDVDGCSNTEELGPNQLLGGRRNPLHFWDVFDTPAGFKDSRDGAVTSVDIFAVLMRFGRSGDPTVDPLSQPPATAYHPAFDRGPSAGPNPWNLTAANGSVASTDVFAVIVQFGLDCS